MKLRLLALLVAAGGLSACGADNDNDTDTPSNLDYSNLELAPVTAAALIPADSETLAAHIKNGLRLQLRQNSFGGGGSGSAPPSNSSSSSSSSASSSGGSSSGSVGGPTPSPTPPGGGASSSGGHSGTNVHVEGIDEADIVKYDGEHWYIAQQPGAEDYRVEPNAKVKIAQLDAAQPAATVVADFAFDDDLNISEMYLAGDSDARQLAVMRQRSGNVAAYLPAWGGFYSYYWYPDNGEFELSLIDVSEPAAPELSDTITIEGSLIDSRRIGDTLYLVTRYDPWLAQLQYDFGDTGLRQANEDALAEASLQVLMPQVTDKVGTRVLTESCLLSQGREDHQGFSPMVFVSAINMAESQLESSICINGQVGGLAMFSDALYLTGELPDGNTVVHKFTVAVDQLEYAATGEVAGTVNGRSDPAFRLDDRDGYLRIVTTEQGSGFGFGPVPAPTPPPISSTSSTSSTSSSGAAGSSSSSGSGEVDGAPIPVSSSSSSSSSTSSTSTSSTSSTSTSSTSTSSTASSTGGPLNWGPVHRLTVLEQQGAELVEVATLPNSARPDPIGKPGEDIYSVRFEEDQAYLVTFRRTDPLYAIDLSDPLDPKIAGELEIPGYASYMHPLAGDFLFTLGMNANEFGQVDGMKFELIKVEDGQPRVVDQILMPAAIGSEALDNLHALSILKVSEQQYRFALPVLQESVDDSSFYYIGHMLQLLEVDLSEQALHDRGQLLGSTGNYYSSVERGLLQDDAVFYASGRGLTAAPFGEPEQAVEAEDLRERPSCEGELGSGFTVFATLTDQAFNECPALKVDQLGGSDRGQFELQGSLMDGGCQYSGPEGAYGSFQTSLEYPEYYASSNSFEVYLNGCNLQVAGAGLWLDPIPKPVPCTGQAVPSFSVDLSLDGEGDACAAEVTAFNENTLGLHTLVGTETDDGCRFEGPFEQTGAFIVNVALAGYVPQMQYHYVGSDACHVITQGISLLLEEVETVPVEE